MRPTSRSASSPATRAPRGCEIEQSGWQRFGDEAGPWRDRNRVGWDSLLPHFSESDTRGTTDGRRHQGRPLGCSRPRPARRATRCTATTTPIRRSSSARSARRRLTYLARAVDDLHAWLQAQGDWVPLGAADEQKIAAPKHGRGLGSSRGQPGRRLVRPAQGLPRTLRHVPTAAPRGARPRRAHSRRRATTRCEPCDGSADKRPLHDPRRGRGRCQPAAHRHRLRRARTMSSLPACPTVSPAPRTASASSTSRSSRASPIRLLALASFQAFSSTIAERVVAPPVVRTAEVVARYR